MNVVDKNPFIGEFYCHFCNRSRPRKGVVDVMGAAMCNKCCINQANRRQLAFLLEGPISFVIFFAYLVVLGVVVGLLEAHPNSGAGYVTPLVLLGFIVFWVLSPLRRDCTYFGALGKRICGVRAVDRDTLEPIGAAASYKRNLVLFAPFAKLLIGGSMHKGVQRCGDGWANSIVLRKKDLNHPVFHGAKTCHDCWDIYDPSDPAGCEMCGSKIPSEAAA